MESVAKSCITNGLLIYLWLIIFAFPHILGKPSNIRLCNHIYDENLVFFFYQSEFTLSRICNHVTEATEEKEGQEENPNRLLVLQLLARLPEEVRSVF
jgi:hypothetical protein